MLQFIRASIDHASRIDTILNAAPTYNQNTEGVAFINEAGMQTIQAIPPNLAFEKKLVYIVQIDNKDIGIIDILIDYPKHETAFLGLLLIKEDFQNKGIGTLIYTKLEKDLLDKGMRKLRLAVVDSNPVEPFWEKLGFKRTGQTSAHEGISLKSTKRVLEKEF